jgi:flavoprotein
MEPDVKRLAATLVTLCFVSAAHAQQVPPYTYPQTLGTSSVQVLPVNPARKKVIFHNPNATALIAVCPVGPTRAVGGSTALITAAINGAGCITLLPYDRVEVSGSTASGPQQSMGSAWVGIASAASSAFTVLEFE